MDAEHVQLHALNSRGTTVPNLSHGLVTSSSSSRRDTPADTQSINDTATPIPTQIQVDGGYGWVIVLSCSVIRQARYI